MKKTIFNRNILKKSLAAFALTSLLFAAGCADADSDESETTSQTQESQGNKEDENAVIEVNGEKVPASSISLTMSQATLSFDLPDEKAEEPLSVKGLKNNMLTWSSSDPYVASVDQNGYVTSLSGGETEIIAALTAAPSKKAVCKVTVAEPNRAATTDSVNPKSLTGNIDIITCGDSIMTDYAPKDNDQYGLGQALAFFFDSSKATVDNSVSAGGRSTRMFWNAPNRWAVVKEKIAASKAAGKTPVVFFCFGHNDQRSIDGADSAVTDDGGKYAGASFAFAEKNQNGTVAGTTYDYFERLVITTRELGGIPVLVTPFVRDNMDGSEVSAYGKHDWTNKKMKNKNGEESVGRGNYPEAIRKVAQKHSTILVDLTELSAAYVAQSHADGKSAFVYISDDSTHETTLGAFRLAEMVTKSLKDDGYFSDYIKTPDARLMVNKNALAFGKAFVNGKKMQSFRISNFNTNSGTVTITLPEGYTASLNKEDEASFKSPLTIDCSSADFKYGADIYVKFNPTAEKSYNGTLKITHTSVTPDFGNTAKGTISGKELQISLTGGVRKMPTGGGKDIEITWAMVDSSGKYSDKATVSAKTDDGEDLVDTSLSLTGLATPSVKAGKPSGKKAARITTATEWPTNDGGVKLNGIEVNGKKYDIYMEYEIPETGMTLFIDKISMEIGSTGSANMYWHIEYSDDNRASWTPIFTDSTHWGQAEKDDVKAMEASDLGISASENFYLRIYPAFKDTKENTNGRAMLIKDLKFIGKVE